LQLKKIGVIESSEIISRAASHNSPMFRDDSLSGKLNWGAMPPCSCLGAAPGCWTVMRELLCGKNI